MISSAILVGKYATFFTVLITNHGDKYVNSLRFQPMGKHFAKIIKKPKKLPCYYLLQSVPTFLEQHSSEFRERVKGRAPLVEFRRLCERPCECHEPMLTPWRRADSDISQKEKDTS